MTSPSTCDQCDSRSSVKDSRDREGYRIRRHECSGCKLRWSTIEIKITGNNKSYAELAPFFSLVLNGPFHRVKAFIDLGKVWNK